MSSAKRKRGAVPEHDIDGNGEGSPAAALHQPAPSLNQEEKRALPSQSVFRIEVTKSTNDYRRPWQPSVQSMASGSGFAIRYTGPDGEPTLGVITNAHVVHDYSIIHVVKQGTTKKFQASLTPQYLAVDLDLALLTISDPSFWRSVPPLTLSAELPELFSDVMVVGYPTGGRQICVTKGVVSRITSNQFSIDYWPGAKLLCMQIDAAINPGNSGGPTLFGAGQGLKVCGVATRKLTGHLYDNVGYLIPSSTVLRFLKDIEARGEFRGVVGKGFSWSPLENPAMRRRNALPEETNDGVLITNMHTYNVDQTTSSQLLAGDVLTSIDGIPVASNGDVTLDNGQPSAALGQINQTKLDVLFSMRRHGDKVKLRVLRKEKVYDDEPLSDPIALGAEVLLRHNVRWRWEKDMTHQAKPRTGKVIRIRRLKPAVDAAGARRPCWQVIDKNEPTSGGPRYMYDVLDAVAGQVSEGHLAKDLMKSQPWFSGVYKRSAQEFDVTLYSMPVMQSVRQHQPGATLTYLMVGGLIFINQVWAPIRKRGRNSVALPPVTWRPRVDPLDQQVYLAEIYQHNCNFGYTVATHGGLLQMANGVHVATLRQLKDLVSSLSEGFIELVTEHGTILLDVQECAQALPALLKNCNMQNFCSADLLNDSEKRALEQRN